MDIKIAGQYRVCKKLGEGAFGILYQGVHVKTNEEVAIKLERKTVENPVLLYEGQLYDKLHGQ